ncbi:MAG: Two component, sigma54 specific, transcriptional regulator, Fis family [Candidatus Uhrbacteria bacterium GW2011_GWD2_52_7]|uniref:Two component, sigma54 specific, transcriptional regulator, Fis family n=1 Tax=Candidatus Uhrbacteria bacterium GW2011_GWD2_52_7 TaxID=1618989 RepID=A0A0G2AD99_9BACT|nr:MAG: Two component, sigma54 specific, transcriptional regulator, Fis family [Candidatus Uhrbacteria bacterium GW2011_GWD2_52_7]
MEKPKVLVVDDAEIMRQIFQELLADDFDVMVAETVNEALQIIEAEPLVVVIVDWILRGECGGEVYQIAHAELVARKIAFMVVTGDQALASDFSRETGVRMLLKPENINLHTLPGILREEIAKVRG